MLERTLLRHFPNGILILCDHDLRWVVVDGAELARTGRTAAELEGKRIDELYPPEVVREIEPHLRRALAGESVSYEVELRGRRSFVQGEPVYGADGAVAYAALSTQEVSELRQKLGDLEEQQRALLDHLSDTVVSVLDTELRYVQISRSLLGLGWRREDLLGKRVDDVLADRPEAIELFHRALAGEEQAADYTSVAGGREFWLRLAPLRRGEEIVGVLSVAQDVTDRNALQRELAEVRRAESLTVLAAGIAHDFNNLLQGVLGHAALALMELPEDTPVRRRLESIQTAATEAADLSLKMLAFAGRSGLERSEIDISRLVAESLDGLPVTLRLASGLPLVMGDAGQLAAVTPALVQNALEAGGAVTVATSAVDEDVVIVVCDDGEGMDAGTRSRMFEPFFSTRFAGRGLGLAAVDGIVRAHGGRIDVASTSGEGTCIRVALPAAA